MDEELTAPQYRVFAGYTLLQPLASSTRAVLYRVDRSAGQAQQNLLLKRYKFSNLAFSKDLQRRCAFLRRVHHPSLPTILDQGVSGERPFIVRKYISGLNLRQIQRIYASRREAFPIEQLVNMLLSVLEAMDIVQRTSFKAGRAQLSHAELSASHILLDFAGQAHILGFESNRLLEGQASAASTSAAVLDCTLPAALLYQQIRMNSLHAQKAQDDLSAQRSSLEHRLVPVLRRTLQLSAGEKALQSPGELAAELQKCLEQQGFVAINSQLFGQELSHIAEELGQKDPSAILVLPMRQENVSAQVPGEMPNILNFSSDDDLVPPPLDDDDDDVTRYAPLPEAPKREIPAPIDFGLGSADKSTQSLPPFEVKEGHQALHDSQAQFLGEQFSEILDPFDEQSAEFELSSHPPSQNPFEPVTAAAFFSGTELASTNKQFGSIISDFGYLTSAALHKVLQNIGENQSLVEYLQQQGLLDPEQVLDVLGRYYDMRVLSDDEVDLLHPDARLHDTLPASFIAAHMIVPLRRDEIKLAATVLTSRPRAQQQLVEAKILLDAEQLRVMLASTKAVKGLIAQLYAD